MHKRIYLKIVLSFFLLFSFCLVAKAVDLQVPIPGQPEAGKDLASYVAALYTFGISAISIVAVVMIMWSGMQWITAAGNASQIGEARKRLADAIVGLILALCSYGLLYLINPALVELKMPKINIIEKTEIKTGKETEMAKISCNQNSDCEMDGSGKIVYDYICPRYNCAGELKELPADQRKCMYAQYWWQCGDSSKPACSVYGKKCFKNSSIGVVGGCCDKRLVCNTYIPFFSVYSDYQCRPLGKKGDKCGRDIECENGLKCNWLSDCVAQ